MSKMQGKQTLAGARASAYRFLVVLMLVVLLGAACAPAAPAESDVATSTAVPLASGNGEADPAGELGGSSTAEESYPRQEVAVPTVAEGAYPVEPLPLPTATALPEGYPASTGEEFAEPRFSLDQPLMAGGTTITGSAPPDLSLAILDITYNGAILGTGRSDADGRFEIAVQPLAEGHRVGVTFGELEEGMSLPEMSQEYFPHRGEGFMNLPNVGIFFDTALVES